MLLRVGQATKLERVINLKAAKALGLTIPAWAEGEVRWTRIRTALSVGRRRVR
jgi:hypothetical protein